MNFLTVIAVATISFVVGSQMTETDLPSFGQEMDWRKVGKNTNGTEIYIDIKNVLNENTDSATFTLLTLGKNETTTVNIRVNCTERSVQFGPAVISKFIGEQTVHREWDSESTKEFVSGSAAGIVVEAFCKKDSTPKISV